METATLILMAIAVVLLYLAYKLGEKRGAKQVFKYTRKEVNNYDRFEVDLSKYFHSIHHDVLKNELTKRIKKTPRKIDLCKFDGGVKL